MKLSPLEKNLLALLTFRGEASVRDLAQELRVREHKVRYALEKLTRSRSCHFYPFINFPRVGLTEFELFIALKSGGTEPRQRFVEALQKCPQVRLVGVLGGEYQLDVVVLARGIEDLRRTIDSLSRAAPGIDYQMDLTIVVSVTYFAANFLEAERKVDQTVKFGPASSIYSMDELDKRLVEALYNKEYTSLRVLSRDLKVAEQTVGYRIQRLKKEQVIMELGYVIDHVRVGLSMTTLLIKAKRPSQELTKRIIAACHQIKSVCFVVESYGVWDYQIGVMLYESTQLTAVIDRIRENSGGELDRMVSVPSFETVKWAISL